MREYVDDIGVEHRPLKLWAVGARFSTSGETQLCGTIIKRRLKPMSLIVAEEYVTVLDGAPINEHGEPFWTIVPAWLMDRCVDLGHNEENQ